MICWAHKSHKMEEPSELYQQAMMEEANGEWPKMDVLDDYAT